MYSPSWTIASLGARKNHRVNNKERKINEINLPVCRLYQARQLFGSAAPPAAAESLIWPIILYFICWRIHCSESPNEKEPNLVCDPTSNAIWLNFINSELYGDGSCWSCRTWNEKKNRTFLIFAMNSTKIRMLLLLHEAWARQWDESELEPFPNIQYLRSYIELRIHETKMKTTAN